MNLPPPTRRRVIQTSLAAAASMALPGLVRAQAFPAKPIRLICPGRQAAQPMQSCGLWQKAPARRWAARWSSTTNQVPAECWGPTSWSAQNPMATRCRS